MFHTNAQTGVSFSPEYHHRPLFFSQPALARTPFGDMYVHKKSPTSPENTLFPGLNLKVGKMNYSLGKWTPTGKNV